MFFTTKMDGTLDIWDYFFKQNDPTFTLQVPTAQKFPGAEDHPRGGGVFLIWRVILYVQSVLAKGCPEGLHAHRAASFDSTGRFHAKK